MFFIVHNWMIWQSLEKLTGLYPSLNSEFFQHHKRALQPSILFLLFLLCGIQSWRKDNRLLHEIKRRGGEGGLEILKDLLSVWFIPDYEIFKILPQGEQPLAALALEEGERKAKNKKKAPKPFVTFCLPEGAVEELKRKFSLSPCLIIVKVTSYRKNSFSAYI